MSESKSVQDTVVKAAGIVVLMNLISRLLGFVRDAVIANEFGASGATDAYLAAYTLPYALQAVLGMAFVSVIVPVITSYLVKNNYDEAWKAGSIVLNWTFVILAAISVLGVIFAPLLISILVPGFTPEQKIITVKLTRIIFPSIIFMGSGMLLTGFLNAGGVFGVPAFAPGFTNIVIILSVVLLGAQYRVEGLAAGTLVGYIGFLILQIPALNKVNFKYEFNFNYKHTAVKQVAAAILPVTLSVAVNQAYLAVNRVFASGLMMGSITSLDFAYRLMALPLGIFVMAVATAIYPEFSKKAADSNYEELSNTLLKGLNLTAFISIPAAVGLIVLRFPLVKFVFERGAFDSLATSMTAEALLFFSIGLFGVGSNLVITRAYYSMGNYRAPLLVGIFSVIINIILSFIFLPYMGHGGLALANSLAALTSVILLLYKFKRDVYNIKILYFIKNLFKMFFAAVFMGIVVAILLPIIKGLVGVNFIGLAVQLIILALCGAVIYALIAYILKIQEVHDLVVIVIKKLKIT